MEERIDRVERTGESEQERLNRNMNELLQELRVSQTGVQILFAFLLTLPFTQRFTKVTTFQRDVYFASLLLAGAASAFFIAPVSIHRLLFRRKEKARLIAASNWMAIAGLACIAVAMVGVILLIADFLFGALTAGLVAGFAGLTFAMLWYALPLSWLLRQAQRDAAGSAEPPPRRDG
jgi:ABC-type multidrug transport system fused ATPase/permease subunit